MTYEAALAKLEEGKELTAEEKAEIEKALATHEEEEGWADSGWNSSSQNC